MQLQSLFSKHIHLPDPNQSLDPKLLPGTGGVCALTDQHGHLILTLSAENLRRCLMHRFDPPETAHRPRANLRAVTTDVWWRPTYSTFETAWTYLQIARQLKTPDRYHKELTFGPTWFARLNPDQPHPRWRCDKFAFAPPTRDLGPFANRASCRRFIELLEDLFDLCRYHDILQQAPKGQACAYKEMGRCPAPCDGSITMQQYRDMLLQSLRFACGSSDQRLTLLRQSMQTASGDLQFERAARLREQIARAEKLLASDGRIQVTPEDFRYLSVQRGPGTSHLKPFFIDRGHIQEGQTASLKDVESVAAQWADNIRRRDTDVTQQSAQQRSEHLWLVCHFLLKGPKAPGLFIHCSELSDAGQLAERISDRFKRAPKPDNALPPVDRSDGQPLE